MNEIKEVNGNSFYDDRGVVKFVNDFDLSQFKRFYTVENHSRGFIRAWHGHKKETKAITCLCGAALIGIVNMETGEVTKYTLSANSPKVIIVPPGHANGAKTLTDDCVLMYFSDKTVEESKGDDYRLPWNNWGGTWDEVYR